MHERVIAEIQDDLKWLKANAVRARRGEVTATSPLTVDLGDAGVPLPNCKTLAGWTPVIGDQVQVLRWGHDLIVLPGAIA